MILLSSNGFDVRQARASDIPRLMELERIRFGNGATEVYDDDAHMRAWLEVNPEGLLVAEQEGLVWGFRYSQYVDFEFSDIARLTTHDDFSDSGLTRRTHRPNGNCINGVTVCSDKPGGGRVLFEIIFRQLREQRRKYYFGFSRIAGFDAYCRGLEASGVDVARLGEKNVATWYALECARLAGGLVWETVTPVKLELPPPSGPDPVLSKYLRHEGFGIAAVLPNWMVDKASRRFGVMVLYKNPDL